MQRRIDGYYDFQDGDKLKVRGQVIATVKHKDGTNGPYWEIQCNDKYENSIFVSYDSECDADMKDACINCIWSGLTIGMLWKRK